MASATLGTAPTVKLPLNRSSPSASPVPRISFSQSQTLDTPLSVSISSISPSTASSAPLYIYCGRGDRKTAKGKRFVGSFGNARPRNKNKGRGPPRVPMPPSTEKADRFDIDDKDETEKE